MNEEQVSFLIKAASIIPKTQNDHTNTLLKSYYLMRCRELSKNHGLPAKYFSSKVRCSRCLTEWKKDTETKIQSVKLSKRQRRRIKRYKITNKNKELVKSKQELLNSNQLEQICAFCKNSTVIHILKPTKPKLENIPVDTSTKIANQTTQNSTKASDSKKLNPAKKVEIDVYSKTKDIFSLTNKNNNIQGVVKEQKVIRNNKKKKDKFAGLCQQAVLASAKLKQEKEKHNKLNLFLKPSL